MSFEIYTYNPSVTHHSLHLSSLLASTTAGVSFIKRKEGHLLGQYRDRTRLQERQRQHSAMRL